MTVGAEAAENGVEGAGAAGKWRTRSSSLFPGLTSRALPDSHRLYAEHCLDAPDFFTVPLIAHGIVERFELRDQGGR